MECATGKGKLLLFYKISTRLAGAMEKEVGEESKKKKSEKPELYTPAPNSQKPLCNWC